MRIGAIEAGGTKFVCGIGDEYGRIEDHISFPTEHPNLTMPKVIDYFQDKKVEAIGIGSFGPIDIALSSPTYGYVTTTPKRGWSNTDFLGTLKRFFSVPFGWDTDVNAAAYGEVKWGAAQGLSSCLYITVGTGIGVGVYSEGRLVHGLVHPEGGHVLTRRHPEDDFAGICLYHGDCLEGLAAGPAIEARWGKKGYELPAEHKAWEMEAFYIAQSITQSILLLSPQKVILGGGVMQQPQLFPLIREAVRRNLNGYVSSSAILDHIDAYITAPGLGQQAGICGALALGLAAAS
jgi:fructokinase